MTLSDKLLLYLSRLFGRASQCVSFCEGLYPKGKKRTQCVRDGAAHNSGNLCDACENDISRICSGPSGSHVCCKPMQVCDRARGVCV